MSLFSHLTVIFSHLTVIFSHLTVIFSHFDLWKPYTARLSDPLKKEKKKKRKKEKRFFHEKQPYALAKARTLLKLVPRFVGQFLINFSYKF